MKKILYVRHTQKSVNSLWFLMLHTCKYSSSYHEWICLSLMISLNQVITGVFIILCSKRYFLVLKWKDTIRHRGRWGETWWILIWNRTLSENWEWGNRSVSCGTARNVPVNDVGMLQSLYMYMTCISYLPHTTWTYNV